ncbi:MAG: Serine hydroxymethyltransferase [Planctomycetes bacterium]|nr:Serine hydroxymethyltransferase [Planctomycetota bacterium]
MTALHPHSAQSDGAASCTSSGSCPRAKPLAEIDPEVAALVRDEDRRQTLGLQLIASENIASAAVREAVGSVLTNKYAEGTPGRRYYSGCEVADQVEALAQKRAQALFSTDYHVNVQPHSGTQANLAVYLAALKPGDTILALDLNQGGHLSHGFRLNQSGKLYKAAFYSLSQSSDRLDYDAILGQAREMTPRLIVAGASAYPRTIDFSKFGEIARSVGALLHADIAHIAGLVAAGLHPTPFGHADFVTTTTHKTLRGPRGGLVFCRGEHQKAVDSAVFPGLQGGPLEHEIAGKAVAFHEGLQPSFRAYQERVLANARVLGEELSARGWRLVTGGTDNHLLLVDLGGVLDGAEAQERLARRRIYANKNLIPFDTRPATKPSGIRLGTPAMTTRGLGEAEFREVARVVDDVLRGRASDADVDARVAKLAAG